MILAFGGNTDDQASHVSLVIPDDTLRCLHNKNTGLNNLLFCFIDTVWDSYAINQIGADFFFTRSECIQIVSTDETQRGQVLRNQFECIIFRRYLSI